MNKGASFAQLDSNQQDMGMHYPFKQKKKRRKKDLSVQEDEIIIQDIDQEEAIKKDKKRQIVESMLQEQEKQKKQLYTALKQKEMIIPKQPQFIHNKMASKKKPIKQNYFIGQSIPNKKTNSQRQKDVGENNFASQLKDRNITFTSNVKQKVTLQRGGNKYSDSEGDEDFWDI